MASKKEALIVHRLRREKPPSEPENSTLPVSGIRALAARTDRLSGRYRFNEPVLSSHAKLRRRAAMPRHLPTSRDGQARAGSAPIESERDSIFYFDAFSSREPGSHPGSSPGEASPENALGEVRNHLFPEQCHRSLTIRATLSRPPEITDHVLETQLADLVLQKTYHLLWSPDDDDPSLI